MKKLLFTVAILLAVSCIFVSCDRADIITVEDGYLVVNGNKTEHKVDVGGAVTENGGKDEAAVITVEDGYLVVDGVKTEYKVDQLDTVTVKDGYLVVGGVKTEYEVNQAAVITVEDGYLVVDGVKTEYKVDKADVITVEDGYLVVNGVKTEYEVNQAAVITVEDGYVVVDGVKTEYEVHRDAVITVEDGYLVVDGLKTEYEVELTCDHVWETVTTPPTCTEEGYDTKTCSVCEKRVRTNVTEAKAHDYSRGFQLDNNYHWLECAVCEEVSDHAVHTLDDEGICSVCQLPVASTPGVVYNFAGDGSYAEVIGYNGSATKVKIAAEYEGVPVTRIYESAFQNTAITAVVIPDSVTSIGDYAFYYCDSLTAVTIGDSVTSIGESAFFGCRSLTTVTIPDSVTRIYAYAFRCCSNLASVTIPDSVVSIGYLALSDCHSSLYTEYEFCKYVKSGENPYAVLIAVTNENMSSYTLHEDTRHIAGGVFSDCERLVTIAIPDSVTRIVAFAFSGCSSLTSVTIPDSVVSIGSGAFYSCNSLTTVYYGGDANAWENIDIDIIEELNCKLFHATRYDYSETQPATGGNYWRYVDGVPTAW